MGPPLEKAVFSRLESSPQQFFEILPDDWSVEIGPAWPGYEETASVYVIRYLEKIIGGGILFSTPSPDVSYYDTAGLSLLMKWFENGYAYIAYFFVLEKYRGMGLGMKWLTELFRAYPAKGFFLTIDDLSLVGFYEKAGFDLKGEIILKDHKEWLLVRGPE